MHDHPVVFLFFVCFTTWRSLVFRVSLMTNALTRIRLRHARFLCTFFLQLMH